MAAADGGLWLYYMGGNGRHTNFRETSLARARWKPDRFAALTPKRGEENSLITTCRMKFDGGALEVLAEAVDQSRPVYLAAQVHRVWTEAPVSGFTFEESRALDMEDGWRSLQWPKGLDSLAGTTGCIKIEI